MQVGIIGGGMMGLVTAFYLAGSGPHVTIVEREQEVGGLSRSEPIMPDLRWDRFYHVILSTDNELLQFIDDIGLCSDIQFTETNMGFFTDNQLHSMSTTSDFLLFKPLSLWDKFRLGAGILYSSRIDNWERLEEVSAKTWLARVFGHTNYEKLWDPLLRSKMGVAKDQVSAAFIWGAIKRMYGTRQKSSKKELMGCVKGGHYSILNAVQKKLREKGVVILVDHKVQKLKPLPTGQIGLGCTNGKGLTFDRVVAAVPNPEITGFWHDMPDNLKRDLEKVRYLSLICATLVLRKSLCPYYVINLTDPGFPFTGIIEATNVAPRDDLGGKALVYLPRYMAPGDPFLENSDKEVLAIFIEALRRVFPDFSNQDILATLVHREPYVQPIQEINYSRSIPSMKTPLRNFYQVNTTMILNSTLNNNQVVQLARKMANLLLSE
jgi:protoporphyrinogen oxidase